MNGKQAKRLRSLAQENTIGEPAVAYKGMSRRNPQITLDTSTRGLYQKLKRIYKKEKRNA